MFSRFSWRSLADALRRRSWRRSPVGIGALGVMALSAWLGFTLSERQGILDERVGANHRLDLFASAVDGVIKRMEPVPATIQLNQDVLALLREPRSVARVHAVNFYLRRLNAHMGSISIYVLNDRGMVLASSNGEPGEDSSVGEDLSFRPYFLEALSGRVGRHFAIGVRRNLPGYFVSHPIYDGARVVGVAAIKISLDPIDQTWEMLGAPGLLTDTNQVVILASNPAWLYNALAELPLERRVDLQLTRTYNGLRLPRFPIALAPPVDDGMLMLHRDEPGPGTPARSALPGADTMVLGRTLDGMDWRVMIFVDMGAVHNRAILSGVMAAVAAGFVMLLASHLAQRRRRLRQRIEAEHQLESANAELELKVEGRTRALTQANARLRVEVAEREQIERNLRATQDELIHAAKMAMLGQLATGITHELTQPLGAIRTLSGNAVEFQRRGDEVALSGNLQIIARLADQMGGIIQPLKGFARKSAPVSVSADVARALNNALFLFDGPLRKHGIEVVNRCVPGQLNAWCDPNRLEQVLINLIGNAIDAMCEMPTRVLTLEVAAEPGAPGSAGRVRIDVLDTGAGLPEAVQARLFEPFFTTKAGGAGLGLGLVISRDIVREFNGDIDAASRPEGGSRFSVHLPAGPARPLQQHSMATLA